MKQESMAMDCNTVQSVARSRAVDYSREQGGRGSFDFPAFAVKAIDEDARQIRVLASSDALDRYNERILPEAFRKSIPVFMTNPVVLTGHQHKLSDGEPPVVGSVAKLWIDSKGLWAIIEFARTELAETYWELYREGFMRAVSVAFVPVSYEDNEEGGRRIRVYTEVELLEISLVAVPANPEALVRGGGSRFVEGKRQSRLERIEERELRAGLAERGITVEEFDADCDEYVRLILGLGGDKVIEGDDYAIDDDDGECEFAEVVSRAEQETDQVVAGVPCDCDDFASLVRGDAVGSSIMCGKRREAASRFEESIPFDY